MVRDLYDLKPLLVSFALSSMGVKGEYKDEEIHDQMELLMNIYLDKIYKQLENQTIVITVVRK